jgi:L-fucose isomerase-like protein
MKIVGFVCFGEVNTPIERLQLKHDEAIKSLDKIDDIRIIDVGLVIDDPEYKTADTAVEGLKGKDIDCLVVCVAGWVPTHAVIRVTDKFRHIPMLLWGLCGYIENGNLVSLAAQAGATALRAALEAMGYDFKYVFSIVGKPEPIDKISAFISACYAKTQLRKAHVGTMGYRDMLLYGTQFEGNSLRGRLGVEVEPFEMLEVVQNLETLDEKMISDGIKFIKENWKFAKPCEQSVIEKGVKYALAIKKKIEERGYEAISLIDVDGMKKLAGFPPAMIFMLLEHYCGVLTIPENDIMGSVTQLIMKFITGQTTPYLEYYEFFEKSILLGVPDFIPAAATDGNVEVLPAAFGRLSTSLLNVSKVKTGYVTCARLVYIGGQYKMHIYTGEAKSPRKWEECGWEAPAPQLPSLEVFPDSCSLEEFTQKVASQHVIVCYGNYTEALRDFCKLEGIEII